MKRTAILVPAIVLIALVSGLFPCPPVSGASDQVLLRLSDRREVRLHEAVYDWKSVKVVLVGELHNEKKHHEIQLEVIRALHNTGLQVAVGMEMFRRESQGVIDEWVRGTLSEAAFQRAYYDNWNSPWPLYADIFHYAREKKIPIVGLNVSREITRQVAEKGFASLGEKQKKDLPPVSCAVDESYRKFIRRAMGIHGHHGMNFNNFCEAQILWDAAMAWHTVQYLKAHPQRTIVILAGNGHAWKPGIPKQLEALSGYSCRVILPQMPGKSDRDSATDQDADYLWIE
ncbi:MAG TPA: ChaN family lipoprotein [Syntrophobacter fumaroxidans]|nr:ChaN family lipoprotein [Syntrophobacter fumaroxidans]